MPVVNPIADPDAYRGHGDISTKWYGCLIMFDIDIFIIIHIDQLF